MTVILKVNPIQVGISKGQKLRVMRERTKKHMLVLEK